MLTSQDAAWGDLDRPTRDSLPKISPLPGASDRFHGLDLQNADNYSGTIFFLQGLFLVS